MARLLGIRIKNYRALADVQLGQVVIGKGDPLPRLACLIGPNGSGKSTVLDAFGFLADCLLEGVEAACDKPQRGGFERLRTQGATGPIELEILFEADDPERPIVYTLHVDVDPSDAVPRVVREHLRQRRKGEKKGRLYYFLKLDRGAGKVWAGDAVGGDADSKDSQKVRLASSDKLAVTAFGNLAEHPRISALREYIEGWYLSYFVPDAARTRAPAGAQRFLDRTGSNIGNVLQYYQRQVPEQFDAILKRLTRAIPGLKKISTKVSEDKRLLIQFDEQGYKDPFFQQSMSDGTLKMLAYAILAEDPSPRPFIGIEEPENGLYVRLVERLVSIFERRTTDDSAPTQVLVTTHSPYFVDALRPEQVWLMQRDGAGHSVAKRAADIENINELNAQGIPLGSLWYSDHLGETEVG